MSILLSILKWLFIIISPFLFSYLFFYCYHRFYRHIKPIHGGGSVKRRSIIKRILIDFPNRLALDNLLKDPNDFTETGLRLVVGEQGSGKTITVVYLLMNIYKVRFPQVKIRTNMNYLHEDGVIKSWQDLVFRNNGNLGEIDVIDEIQNWFNSLQSKDFPPEMFGEITQQRKQRKQILGTSQVWQRVAKPIREQVSIVYKPHTFFGCLTIVRFYKPCVDDDGSIDSLKYRGMFFFVHNDELRNAFDTYRKIQVMSLKGFKSSAEQSFTRSGAFPQGCADADC